jgi:hypothetical protein
MALGYGVDTWCGDRLVTGRMSRRSKTPLLAIHRRLITPRGTLRDDPTYGFDVASYVGAVGYTTAIAALPSILRAEISKDDRLANVSARVVATTSAAGLVSLVITVEGFLVDEETDFTLTLGVSDVTVEILTT